MPDQTNPELIASELIDGVSSDHPEEQGRVFGAIILRLLETGLYRGPDDGGWFAASLNEELARLARHHGDASPWPVANVFESGALP